MNIKKTILIVEDSIEINEMLTTYLKKNEYNVLSAYDGEIAKRMLKNEKYDLVLMDLMLPNIGGELLIKELRNYSKVPVIVLSAKSMVETRIEVLKLGADDFIIKPFNLDEVLVRIEAVMRRIDSSSDTLVGKKDILQCGELIYYPGDNRASYKGENIALTSKELQILELLLRCPQKTYSKANLYETVWQDVYYYEDNTINVHVSNLRSKLKKATGHDYVETVWGIGYRLKQEDV